MNMKYGFHFVSYFCVFPRDKNIIRNSFNNRKYLILILLMIVFSIIWFLKVPVYRYGYSYFVSFLALGFAYLCILNSSIKKSAYKFFKFFLILFTIIFVLKNLLRIAKPDEIKRNNFFPKIIFVNKSKIKKIELDHFSYNESVEMCGYNYAPCTHYIDQKLKSKKYYNYKVFLLN